MKSREVIDAHLERIAAVNPRLNAITVEMAESAQAAADAADATITAHQDPGFGQGAGLGERIGPLHGVPFTIKENIDQVGFPTTQAVAALAEAFPPRDAVTVERVLAAGAIPIGRTNMPELGLRVSTDNAFRGLTRNPWHHDRTAGGSSGGEGSAIGSGMSPFGLGNDIGGSIRNPALCCGVMGLKQGYGRIGRAASLPPLDPGISGALMSVEGPLARHVEDLRLLLDLLAPPTSLDLRTAPVPVDGGEYLRRAGLVRSLPGAELEPGQLDALDAAAAGLAAAGWEVVEVEPPEIERTKDLWRHLLGFDFAVSIPLLEPIMGSDEIRVLQRLVDSCDFDQLPPQLMFIERHRLMRLWAEMFNDTPVVVGPGWNRVPFEHGADIVDGNEMRVLDDHLGFIVPANVLGLPVVAMSNGVHDGMPTGVQIYSSHWREDRCLDAAEAVEQHCSVPGPIDPTWS
ncbi:MAG: amidase family protein [Acidimicrobiales bacterium]